MTKVDFDILTAMAYNCAITLDKASNITEVCIDYEDEKGNQVYKMVSMQDIKDHVNRIFDYSEELE